MNPRIRLLAEQAGYTTDMFGVSHWDMPECQKFTQLIVQECIDIIAPYSVRMSRPGEEYLHPILEIKQHFGVEK